MSTTKPSPALAAVGAASDVLRKSERDTAVKWVMDHLLGDKKKAITLPAIAREMLWGSVNSGFLRSNGSLLRTLVSHAYWMQQKDCIIIEFGSITDAAFTRSLHLPVTNISQPLQHTDITQHLGTSIPAEHWRSLFSIAARERRTHCQGPSVDQVLKIQSPTVISSEEKMSSSHLPFGFDDGVAHTKTAAEFFLVFTLRGQPDQIQVKCIGITGDLDQDVPVTLPDRDMTQLCVENALAHAQLPAHEHLVLLFAQQQHSALKLSAEWRKLGQVLHDRLLQM